MLRKTFSAQFVSISKLTTWQIVSGLGLKVFKNCSNNNNSSNNNNNNNNNNNIIMIIIIIIIINSYCGLRPLSLLNWVDLVAGSGSRRNFWAWGLG